VACISEVLIHYTTTGFDVTDVVLVVVGLEAAIFIFFASGSMGRNIKRIELTHGRPILK